MRALNRELGDWMAKDNAQFVQDKNLFDHGYFGFMWQVCCFVPTTIVDAEFQAELGLDDVNLSYLQVRRSWLWSSKDAAAEAGLRARGARGFRNFLKSLSFSPLLASVAPFHPVVSLVVSQAKLGVSFLLETLLHAKEKPSISQWIESTSKAFTASPSACEWFLLHMSQDPWWPHQILFKCPNQASGNSSSYYGRKLEKT